MNIYEETKALAAALEARDVRKWPSLLRDAIDAGSTGTEIIMRIQWTLNEMLSTSANVLTEEDRMRAQAIVFEVETLLSK
jgi:hypothetical protein